MGKLSCYCVNQMFYYTGSKFLWSHHYGMTRSGYNMNKDTWSKLYMDISYSFDDRYDKGNNLDLVIEYLELTKSHPVVLQFLNKLKEAEFEGYSVSTVSDTLLIYLFSIEHKELDTAKAELKGKLHKSLYTTRYGVKKFRKFKKAFDHWLSEEEQYNGFMQTQVLPGYNRTANGRYDDE